MSRHHRLGVCIVIIVVVSPSSAAEGLAAATKGKRIRNTIITATQKTETWARETAQTISKTTTAQT